MSAVDRGLERLGELAASVIGNAAGATVDPRAAVAKLSGAVSSPAVLVCGGLAGAAYLLGRRARN